MLKMRHISYRREERCNIGTKNATGDIDKTITVDTLKHSLLYTIEERSKKNEGQ